MLFMSTNIRRMMKTFERKTFHKNPNIVFRVMEQADKLKVMEQESFAFRDTSINKICNVTVESHFEVVKGDAFKEDKYMISTLAEDTRTKEIVSACRLEPYSDYFNPESLRIPQKHEPLITQVVCNLESFLEGLIKAKGLQPNSHQFVYIKSGFTHDDYNGQGIYAALWEFTEELLKSKGYKYAFSLMVSKPVQKVRIQKFGFEVLKDLPYAEMPVYDEFPFREIVARDPQYKDERVLFGFKELK